MPRGSRRGEILLGLASVALTLGVLEVAVRATGLAEARPTGYAPVNNKLGVRPKNSKGYRDLERQVPKPAGVHRVLSIGDSFAWGFGVEFEDGYPQRLERAMRRRRREPWEVVNLAMPGMNTADQAQQLADEGFAYAPDVVLLGFVLNDSEDAAAAETRRVADWAEPRKPAPRFWDGSALARLVGNRIFATVENRRRVANYLSMYEDGASGWRASRAALSKIGALCRERNVPFVVVIFPLFGNPLDGSYPFRALHHKVARAAEDAGAQVVDLLPAYEGLRWDVLVVNGAADEHPNEIAHRIATDVILHALDRAYPLADRPAPAKPGS
jgi:hypothetical protein